MWLIFCVLIAAGVNAIPAVASPSPAPVSAMVDYRPEHCAYCGADTWCELRPNNKRQCRACKVERYFELYLYPPVNATLGAWTRKCLRNIYGTLDMQTGLRQYLTAYLSMGKQNGKSYLSGGLAVYHLDAEYEEDPEVYGAAGAREQAGIIFKSTTKLIRANPDLNARYKIIASVKKIIRRNGQPGSYEVVSADGDLKDGLRGSLLLRDEIHRWKTAKAETLRDVLTKGQISRREPLDIQVTTAGAQYESSLWFKEYQHAKSVLADPQFDPTYYADIYEADVKRIETDPDYWKSREARVAANPSHEDLGGHLRDAQLVKEMNKALRDPTERSKYFRYNLNVPISTEENPVIDMHAWRLCGGGIDLSGPASFDVEQVIEKWNLRGRPCYAGVDASWTSDLTSVVFIFPPFSGMPKWTFLPFFWMPENKLPELERICRQPFQGWVQMGFLTATEGNAIDLRSVLDRIRWGSRIFDLIEVPYDPQHFRTEAMNLQEEGLNPVEVSQNFMQLSYATKFLLTAYPDQKIRHGNHPVLNWMAACLQLQYDRKDGCQPTKPERLKSSKRIDGIQAIVTGLNRALVAEDDSMPLVVRSVA